MNEKHSKKAKAKAKESSALANTKTSPNKRVSPGSSKPVPKKACTVKFCHHFKTNGGPYETHNRRSVVSTTRTSRLQMAQDMTAAQTKT